MFGDEAAVLVLVTDDRQMSRGARRTTTMHARMTRSVSGAWREWPMPAPDACTSALPRQVTSV